MCRTKAPKWLFGGLSACETSPTPTLTSRASHWRPVLAGNYPEITRDEYPASHFDDAPAPTCMEVWARSGQGRRGKPEGVPPNRRLAHPKKLPALELRLGVADARQDAP